MTSSSPHPTPESPNPSDPPNPVLKQNYQILDTLGQGNSGTTYLAQHLKDGTQVALKELSLRGSQDWKTLELFEREVTLLKTLDHPAIPRYLDSFVIESEQDSQFYLAQTLAPGKTLATWVEQGWRCTEQEVVAIAQQLLEILIYLQSLTPPVIHRDIKPQNIIRNAEGQIALVDFGAVGHTYHNTFMRGSTVVGTFGYMAPEQFRGQATVATDLYGVGATLLFLLTRRSPAELPVNGLRPDFRRQVNLSERLADWLEKLLEPELEERFASAEDALAALKRRSLRRFVPKSAPSLSPIMWMAIGFLAIGLSVAVFSRYQYAFLRFARSENLLISALHSGDIKVEDYLHRGGSESIGGDRGQALLNAAIAQKNSAIVRNFLEKGIDISQPGIDGRLAIHVAARQKKTDMLELLLEHPDIDLNLPNHVGETPVFSAEKEQIALFLIEMGADITLNNAEGKSLVRVAMDRRWYEVLEFCLKMDPDFVTKTETQRELLELAIARRDTVAFTQLVEAGARLQRDAVKRLDLMELSLNMLDSYRRNFLGQFVPLLLTAFADRNSQDIKGFTLLHVAADWEEFEWIQLLIQADVDVNIQDNNGRTALIVWLNSIEFLLNPKIETARLLVEAGTEIELKDKSGKTAFQYAEMTRHPEMIQKELKAKGN